MRVCTGRFKLIVCLCRSHKVQQNTGKLHCIVHCRILSINLLLFFKFYVFMLQFWKGNHPDTFDVQLYVTSPQAPSEQVSSNDFVSYHECDCYFSKCVSTLLSMLSSACASISSVNVIFILKIDSLLCTLMT